VSPRCPPRISPYVTTWAPACTAATNITSSVPGAGQACDLGHEDYPSSGFARSERMGLGCLLEGHRLDGVFEFFPLGEIDEFGKLVPRSPEA